MENVDEHKPKKNIVKTILQLVIFVGLGIFFIWLSLRSLDSNDLKMIRQSIVSINSLHGWLMITIAGLVAVMADFARSVRAKILLEPLHYKVRYSMAFYSVMVCYLGNLALPRLGEVLRCTFLQRYEKVPFQKSLGTVLTERAVDILCWIVFLCIAIGLNSDMLSNLIIDDKTHQTVGMWMEQKGLSIIGNYFIYILIGFVVLLGLVFHWTRKWWSKYPFFVKIKNFFVGIWQGLISIKDLPHPWLFVLWTCILWVCYFFGTYLFFFALPYLQHVGPGAAFAVLVFGTIAFMVSQGGLGSYPLIAAGVLILYGVNYTQGLAAGWIGWILQTVVILIFGLLAMILTSVTKKHDAAEEYEKAHKN